MGLLSLEREEALLSCPHLPPHRLRSGGWAPCPLPPHSALRGHVQALSAEATGMQPKPLPSRPNPSLWKPGKDDRGAHVRTGYRGGRRQPPSDLDAALGPGGLPVCLLKATKPKTVLSYSWCLGHFIKHLRHRADYFSGNHENRKAESTVSVTSCFRSSSHSHVWVRARSSRGPHEGLLWWAFFLSFSSLAFRFLSRKVKIPCRAAFWALDAICKESLQKGLGLKEICVCCGLDSGLCSLLGSEFPHQVSLPRPAGSRSKPLAHSEPDPHLQQWRGPGAFRAPSTDLWHRRWQLRPDWFFWQHPLSGCMEMRSWVIFIFFFLCSFPKLGQEN